MAFPFQNLLGYQLQVYLYRVTLCMCSTAFRSEAKMSRQTTLGRFGFEKSISHRTSLLETKVTDFVSTMSRKIECNHLKL